MKVKEIVNKLSEFDDNKEVFFYCEDVNIEEKKHSL
jgi:hypothetical protein